MSAQLRPMTLGEILDRTFQIYRTRFGVFVAIATLEGLLWMSSNLESKAWFTRHPLQGPRFVFYMSFQFLLWTVLLSLVSGFINLLFRPAFLQATDSWIRRHAPSISESLKATAANFKRVIALNLFEIAVVHLVPGALFIIGALAINAFAGGASTDGPAGILKTLGALSLFAIAAGIFCVLGISLSLTFPSLLFEGFGWLDAVKRSLQLVRGSRWRIFATYAVLAIAARAGIWTLQWGAYFVFRTLPVSRAIFLHLPAYQYVYVLSSAVVVILLAPIYPIALTLIYYDQRIRREGFNIEWSMQAPGLVAPSAPSTGEALRMSLAVAAAPAEESQD